MIEAKLTDENFHQLGILRLARPCEERWDRMKGDDRVRHCERCQLNVYNLAGMTTEEARVLLRRAESGRVCARFFRRFDGTVLTKDCPRGFRFGWKRARQLLPRAAGLMLGVVLLLAVGIGLLTLFGDNLRAMLGQSPGGALAGNETIQMRAANGEQLEVIRMRDFGQNNAY